MTTSTGPRRRRLRPGGAARPRLRALAAAVAVAAAAAAGVVTQPPEAEARRGAEDAAGPEARDFVSAYIRSVRNPGMMPPHVNDWDCEPSPEHPRPVVRIHGTWDNAYATWSMLTPMLKAEGYCTYALNYGDDESGLVGRIPGVYGTQNLEDSSREVADFVDEVLERTGAAEVDLVAHSQGGIHARAYVQRHGGVEQAVGAPVFAAMNAGGETRPGVGYTMIATVWDWNVAPYTGQFLEGGPGADVANVTVQDGCWRDASEHLSMTFSPRVLDMVLLALDDDGPAPADSDVCVPVAPFTGALPGA
ncbi:esterase/lipase family protein [Corynebacterium sp. 335C]